MSDLHYARRQMQSLIASMASCVPSFSQIYSFRSLWQVHKLTSLRDTLDVARLAIACQGPCAVTLVERILSLLANDVADHSTNILG